MAKPNDQAESQPATERESAPVTVAEVPAPVYVPQYVPPMPRQMRVERQGATSEAYTRRFPQIRGGTCEYCGVLDKTVPAQYQYKLCPHYRGMEARCTYCPPTANPDEVIYRADMNVAESPYNPGELIMWCNSYECSRAHEKRFKRSAS